MKCQCNSCLIHGRDGALVHVTVTVDSHGGRSFHWNGNSEMLPKLIGEVQDQMQHEWNLLEDSEIRGIEEETHNAFIAFGRLENKSLAAVIKFCSFLLKGQLYGISFPSYYRTIKDRIEAL